MSDAGLRYRNPAAGRDAPMRGAGANMQTPPQYYVDFYTYVLAFGSIASGATGTINLQVQADSDFEWIESTFSFNFAGAAVTTWTDNLILPALLQITDGGSGRQLLSAATPISTLSGSGKQPFILPESRVFKSRTNIQLTATVYGGTQCDNIYMNMIGRKIFEFGASKR